MEIAKLAVGCEIPTYNHIRLAAWSKGIKMDIRYCRKIYSSYLRQSGIESEIVDPLQSRVPKSVFSRYYFTPGLTYRDRVIRALNELKRKLNDDQRNCCS